MKTVARLRHLGVGPLKVRRFSGTIKGEPVDRAQAILELQGSPTCQALLKLLRSAIANAQNNNGLAPEYLFVSNVMVDQGPSLKRIRPRARGRAFRVLKRSCHVTIELSLKPGMSVEQLKEEVEGKKPRRSKRKKTDDASVRDTAEKPEKAPRKKATRKTTKKTADKAGKEPVAKTTTKKAAAKPVKKGENKGSKE